MIEAKGSSILVSPDPPVSFMVGGPKISGGVYQGYGLSPACRSRSIVFALPSVMQAIPIDVERPCPARPFHLSRFADVLPEAHSLYTASLGGPPLLEGSGRGRLNRWQTFCLLPFLVKRCPSLQAMPPVS